jgi:hypothetical protein
LSKGRTLDESQSVTGYMHPRYAKSLAKFGTPRELPRCGGWILERPISGFAYRDGMGCYPLFACRNWSRLYSDLQEIGDELVSLVLVADPFGKHDTKLLQECFDQVIPYKKHFVTDLHYPSDSIVSKHHWRNTRKALREVYVARCQEPSRFIDEWTRLYAALIKRHSIKGVAALLVSSFAEQLQIPGAVVFRAVHKGTTVGMTIWYAQDEVSYYHLGALSEAGYDLRASFALFWHSIEYFAASGLRWLNLGSSAGVKSNAYDGLSRFKQGWSTDARIAYLCGRIFDQTRYSEVVEATGSHSADYFPAYRRGEFE